MYYNSAASIGRPRAQAPEQGTAGMSVTELNAMITAALRADPRTRDVTVTAEVSGFRNHFASGHWYFSLKDAECAVPCVMYRQNQFRGAQVRPEDGERVTVRGYVDYYSRDGRIQLCILSLRPAGIGGLFEQFEALKRKLESEGLFDPARKRTLPMVPRKVAVVTSASGAALHDILNVSGRRAPAIPIVLVPTPVQGEEAPGGIIRALQRAGRIPGVDVILLGRGGGSAEDLWCFNHEGVARAIAGSPVPVVTGIGHEVDFTISDFTADVRASTPSNAAEIIFPDRGELRSRIALARAALGRAADGQLDRTRLLVKACRERLNLLSPERRIQQRTERIRALRVGLDQQLRIRLDAAGKELSMRRLTLEHAAERRLERFVSALRQTRARLAAISPLNVLDRGYALVYGPEKQILPRASAAGEYREMTLRFADGTLEIVRKEREAHERRGEKL